MRRLSSSYIRLGCSEWYSQSSASRHQARRWGRAVRRAVTAQLAQHDNVHKTGIAIMSNAQAIETDNRYIDFWNAVLVPKFNDWRHILAGGLHLHSAKVFPALAVRRGDSVLGAGLLRTNGRCLRIPAGWSRREADRSGKRPQTNAAFRRKSAPTKRHLWEDRSPEAKHSFRCERGVCFTGLCRHPVLGDVHGAL